MGLFKRKKHEPAPPPIPKIKTPCELGHHMYRDFPPYVYWSWEGSSNYGEASIIEIYCCTLCGKIEKKELDKRTWNNCSRKEFERCKDEFLQQYVDIIKPKGIVMDMVHDAQLVDRQKLKFWDELHAPEPPQKGSELIGNDT